MKLSQKLAISYAISEKKRHNQYCFLVWKDLYHEFENSNYKSMIWFIRNKGLENEYNQAIHYYNNNLENLPRK